MGCADKSLMVALSADGELDAAAEAEFARHLATCPDCARDHARLVALRAALKRDLPRLTAPPGFAERIVAALPPAPARPRVARRPRWPWLASGIGLGGALAAALLLVLRAPDPAEERMTAEIVSSHLRAVVTQHLTDLPASDPAAIGPWFAGKLDSAPPAARDLSAAGYRLEGARLDVVDGRRTAAIVYRKDAHVVTLYLLPTPGRPEGDSDAVVRQGYAVCHWTRAGVTYWAIADLDPDALEDFEAAVTDKS